MTIDTMAPSRCLLILGMHRSGTSAITRCLNLLGMDVGSQLLTPDQGNAKGYWEHVEAVRINEALLAAFDMLWWHLDPLPKGWLQSEAAKIARVEIESFVRRDFSGVPLWGLKDPRMCRLAPLWIDVLSSMGITTNAVFVTRPPLEVARSMARGHGLSEPNCVLSWMQHLAEAELSTREMPRSMIRYEQLLSDPLAAVDRVSTDLSLVWPIAPGERLHALASFVDQGLRTQREDGADVALPSLATCLDAACRDLVSQTKAPRDWSALSAVCDRALENLGLLAYGAGAAVVRDPVGRGSSSGEVAAERAFAALYYGSPGQDFSETRVIKHEISRGRGQIDIPLLAGSAGKYRLDPISHAGYCIIHSLVVVDNKERVVWDWRDAPEQVAPLGVEEVASPSQTGARLHRMNDDPQIHFSWPKGLIPDGALLRLDIEWFDTSRLAREFDALREANARQSDEHEALEHDLTSQFAAERSRLSAELESERSLLSAELEAERSRTSALITHLDETRHRLAELAGVAESSRVALQLLLRRSLIARFRRRFLRINFSLTPVTHLQSVDNTSGRWRVTGNDPSFACGSGQLPLRAGWYMLSVSLQQHSGLPLEARLYPDYGPEVPQDPRGLALPFIRPDKSGHRGVVRFSHTLLGLRFDPAESPGEISLHGLSVRRISKVHAAWVLFKGVAFARAAPGKRAGWRKIVRRLRASGGRGLGHWFYQAYTTPEYETNSYEQWLRKYDAAAPEEIEWARQQVADWKHKPVVSVLVPVYNSPRKWLRRCIESVQAQAYPHWELCLANDASTMPHVASILDEYAAADQRIRVVHRPVNGHISATSNSALALASGEFIALLDHDDELHPLALFEVVKSLQTQPSRKLIYTDEDKIDEQGRRFDPYMKPEWNYDLLLSQNCICHLGVYQRQLVLDVGGFREGYEGSQDWDLALRCIELLKPEEIGHVPHVLYHWRAIPGSTAVGVDQKSYARGAGVRAIEEHLQRVGVQASVKESDAGHGHLHIRYALPTPQPKVSLIIPTRDGLHLLRRCVDSILSLSLYENYEIVIVDNQSCEPETLTYFTEIVADPRVRVLAYDQPFNYSALNNYAVRRTSGELVALVNNDIEVISPDWLLEMAGHAMRPAIGAVGAMLYYPSNRIQHAGVVLGVGGVAGHAYCDRPRGYDGQMGRARIAQGLSAVTAACLMIRRSVFEEAGGLDESLCVAFNDIDFCLRVRRLGYHNLWTPFAELYHHESATRGYEDSPEKQARFAGEVERMRALWGDELVTDPAYSPNLTLTGAPFELAFPPRTGL